jgi:hypothetical protein
MSVLADLPVSHIVRAVSDAAARWADADFPPRVRILDPIAARARYSLPMVEYALDRLFESIHERALSDVIAGELRGPGQALPLGRVCVISSRTTIGVAIVPAIFALCAGCDVVVKDRDDRLVAAFFRALAEEDDRFTIAAQAETWDGAGDAVDLSAFDGVVAFGSDGALAQIRARCSPIARFIGYGSKASAGYVAREALRNETHARTVAEGAARDLVLYEGEGCLSLHVLFVERGAPVAPERFCALLAAATERAAVEFPPPREYDAQVEAKIGAARSMAAFRAAAGRGSVYSDDGASFLLVLDPPGDEPPFFLPRALGIHAVDAPDEAASYFRHQGISLEALAADARRSDIVNLAVHAGAARIARFGELQSPPLSAPHGGRPRIGEFVRWMADET